MNRGMIVTISEISDGVLGKRVYWRDARTGHENLLVCARDFAGKVGDKIKICLGRIV